MTRLLVCHPGASWSTSDVYDGLVPELRALGAECIPYRLDERIERSRRQLNWQWRSWAKRAPEYRPLPADILYLAGQGVLEMALRRAVNLVLVVSGMYLHPDALVLLKRAGVRTAVLLTESPYDDDRQALIAPLVDLLWTNERTSVSVLAAHNPNVRYLPHGWSPASFEGYSPPPGGRLPAHDVVFVGTGFAERIEFLSAVNWDGIDLGLYGTWGDLGSRSHLRKFVRDGLTPNTTAHALYRRAAIGLNLYRQSVGFGRNAPRIAHAESLNPRAYELAAAGVYSISDYRAEVPEVFGDLVPTFASPSEAEALIRGALSDEAMRSETARRLQAAVAPHTHAARARQVLSDLAECGLAVPSRPLEAVG